MKYSKIIIFLIFALLLSGCGQDIKQAASPENVLGKNWTEIEKMAKDTEVNMFMWGGDEGVNRYMDQWVAPQLKEKYKISFQRTPMDINNVLQKLQAEKQADSAQGTIGVIWLNGENFKNAKENGLLAKPFVNLLPNYQNYINQQSPNIQFDFGTPVDNLEAPWGKVQFVFHYNSAKISQPPKTFTELAEWIKQNPGKFTYPEPADFTGNAFLRHLLYEKTGHETLLANGSNTSYVNENSKPMWEYLKEIEPYLWREGETYPQSLAQLDQLYSQEEVYMTMGYNEARAESLIKQGIFPSTTRSFVLETGSIGNTHFLSIPYNSPNIAGALITINFLLSPEAQLAKMDPSMWGEDTVLDLEKLPKEDVQNFTSINRGESVLPSEQLKKVLRPEISPAYSEWIKENWLSEVVQ